MDNEYKGIMTMLFTDLKKETKTYQYILQMCYVYMWLCESFKGLIAFRRK